MAAGVGALVGGVASVVADKIVQSKPVKNAARDHPDRIQNARKIGRAGLEALGEIFQAMDDAAKTVMSATGHATTQVVQHR